VKHKECIVIFISKKYLSPNFIKDSRIAKSVLEVEILRGINLKRYSDKDSAEGRKFVEYFEVQVRSLPNNSISLTVVRYK
jgi:hypothetical protein